MKKVFKTLIFILFALTLISCKGKYSVSFDTDGGIPELTTIKVKNKLGEVSSPEKAGYEFLGWYKDDILYTSESLITGNITLKAKYRSLPKITNTKDFTYYISDPTPNFLVGVNVTDVESSKINLSVDTSDVDFTKEGNYKISFIAINEFGGKTVIDQEIKVIHKNRQTILENTTKYEVVMQYEKPILGFSLIVDYQLLDSSKTKADLRVNLNQLFSSWISDINITDDQIIVIATGLDEIDLYLYTTLIEITKNIEVNLTIKSLIFDTADNNDLTIK